MFDFAERKHLGIALFISVLMTMSLSIIALATMARLSETAHTTGKDLQDRKLLAYTYSAVNIVNGELRELVDSSLQFDDAYSISGGLGGSSTENEGNFRYYPRDISYATNAASAPKFAYRAAARRLTTKEDALVYGLNADGSTVYDPDKSACYDITVDVREVLYVGSNNYVTFKETSNKIPGKSDFALGKMKTVGMVACFSRDGINAWTEDEEGD
ncbi:hypothetical protein II898_00135 [bacterium]|nr:hypothetical protein [bacterium]